MAFPGPQSIFSTLRRALLVIGISALAGLLAAGLALPVAAGLGLVARESANGFSDMPADLDTSNPLPERSRILDADDNLIAIFYTENRVSKPLEDIAPVMQDAVLAIEDHRFFDHGPIDFRGTARAFFVNAEAGGITAGGSTLTQQYAKLLTLAQAETDEERRAAVEESYGRKLRELRVAVGLEQEMTKEEILEGYLNIAYFGGGAHGVEAAARRYFSTSAAELTLAQAALLAGIIQLPNSYDPAANPERALARRDVVLRRMHDLEMITDDELREAMATGLELDERIARNGCGGSSAEFFCEYVVQEIQKMEALGATPEERVAALYRGGLTIRTTLDRDAQRAAQKAIAERVHPTDKAAAALASVEPGTGAIKALAQSKPYGNDEDNGQTTLNLAVDEDMGGGGGAQSGSTFKVWWLAAAIEQGIALNMSINSPYQVNLPVNSFEGCEGQIRSTEVWRPKNYDTGLSGLFNLRTGTERSVNTFYAQLAQQTGLCDPLRIAAEGGVTQANGDPLQEVPANVLGSNPVSPLTMAEGYAMFAARGEHCESYAVQNVTDRTGEDVFNAEPECNQVLAKEHADGINDVLRGVMFNSGGTGTRMRLDDGRDSAGKTGTTNDTVAVWWVGYIPQLVTAVAVFDPRGAWDFENDRPRSLSGYSFAGERITNVCGSCVPGPIWKQMMEAVVDKYEPESFVEPDPKVVQGALTPVPDVRGRSQADAEEELREAGFRPYVAGEVPSQHPAGTVVDTQPGPYSDHPSGGSVGLIISNGSAPQQDPPGSDGGPPGNGDEPDEDGDRDRGPGGGNDDGIPVPEPTTTG
ncbi:MAG TPA: transglycosylase domain-containing protein [Jiangellaceae bacterium]|nr:transglycosylase domain-containing protein [Jiangellaceae bacterium]